MPNVYFSLAFSSFSEELKLIEAALLVDTRKNSVVDTTPSPQPSPFMYPRTEENKELLLCAGPMAEC